jgi:hypothetical protein
VSEPNLARDLFDESRALSIPWEGVESLKVVLGIVDDQEFALDESARHTLDAKLAAAPKELGPISAGGEAENLTLHLTMPEASLLLQALHFTDVMSMELPFYDMVVQTIQFIGDRLTALWSPADWMAFRDSR